MGLSGGCGRWQIGLAVRSGPKASNARKEPKPERYKETYPLASIVHYNFPARGDMLPVKFTRMTVVSSRRAGRTGGRPSPKGDGEEEDEGLLFVGDRGKILCAFNGGSPKLIPAAKMQSYKQPPKTLPRSRGNEREWLDACKGSKVKPGRNFEFSGMVTKTLLLGNGATRVGQRLDWDRFQLKVVYSDSAQKFVSRERRTGWEL